jgi:hypothetical protein
VHLIFRCGGIKLLDSIRADDLALCLAAFVSASLSRRCGLIWKRKLNAALGKHLIRGVKKVVDIEEVCAIEGGALVDGACRKPLPRGLNGTPDALLLECWQMAPNTSATQFSSWPNLPIFWAMRMPTPSREPFEPEKGCRPATGARRKGRLAPQALQNPTESVEQQPDELFQQ